MKNFVIIFLFSCCSFKAFGQVNIQHYEGTSAIEGSVSKNGIGTKVNFGYSKYISDKVYWKISAGYGTGRKYQILIREFSIDALAYYSPLNFNGLIFFNLAAGPTVIHEKLKNFEPSTTGILNPGAKLGFELEVPVYDGFLIIGNGYQNFFLKKDYGSKRLEFGLGIKILIN